jgi:hypothetical protein
MRVTLADKRFIYPDIGSHSKIVVQYKCKKMLQVATIQNKRIKPILINGFAVLVDYDVNAITLEEGKVCYAKLTDVIQKEIDNLK